MGYKENQELIIQIILFNSLKKMKFREMFELKPLEIEVKVKQCYTYRPDS